MASTSSIFTVSLNSTKVLEYFRERELNQKQIDDLKQLEAKLNKGISIAGKYLKAPSTKDKAIFMANNLANALLTENESIAAISSAYLATRYPDVKHLKIATRDNQLSIEIIYDKEFTEQTPIKFISKTDLV